MCPLAANSESFKTANDRFKLRLGSQDKYTESKYKIVTVTDWHWFVVYTLRQDSILYPSFEFGSNCEFFALFWGQNPDFQSFNRKSNLWTKSGLLPQCEMRHFQTLPLTEISFKDFHFSHDYCRVQQKISSPINGLHLKNFVKASIRITAFQRFLLLRLICLKVRF